MSHSVLIYYSQIQSPTLDQHMVETRSLFNAGLKSGAVDNDAIMVGVKEGYRLIAAPAASTHSSYAVMIWEPTDDQDRKPTYDKVVRIF